MRKSYLKYGKKWTYLVVPDYAAGRHNRFTIYRIPKSPSRRIKIVGRELTKQYCFSFIDSMENYG